MDEEIPRAAAVVSDGPAQRAGTRGTRAEAEADLPVNHTGLHGTSHQALGVRRPPVPGTLR